MTPVLRLARVALAATLLALALPVLAQQPDTSLARQVYAEVNAQVPRMQRATFNAKRPDVEYRSEVKAWADASGVRKVEVVDRDDSGDVVTEYYYANGALVFAYQAVKGYEGRRPVTRVEQRQYFRDGRMFHWLGGTERAPQDPKSRDFVEESKERAAAGAFYLRAARRALAR